MSGVKRQLYKHNETNERVMVLGVAKPKKNPNGSDVVIFCNIYEQFNYLLNIDEFNAQYTIVAKPA